MPGGRGSFLFETLKSSLKNYEKLDQRSAHLDQRAHYHRHITIDTDPGQVTVTYRPRS